MATLGSPDDAGAAAARAPRILLYSDDAHTREQVLLGVGRRLGRGTPDIEWEEVATPYVALQRAAEGAFDLLIFDGEAAKTGGMGMARQVKDEVFRCPPVLVLTGRSQDAWLAAWSEADGVVSQPLDPVELHRVVTELLAAGAVA
ncbi:hypothetical protein [Cellulomonas hominis]